jgi:MOSC domain-containing protein YiiM
MAAVWAFFSIKSMNSNIDAVFVGGLRALPPEGQLTGMFKTRVAGPVAVGREGLQGDVQADRRVHGGPEKAVHYYPAEHYARLAERVPALAGLLLPGVLGENLSGFGLSEETVCIGDVFAIGGCRLQVSQPRQPCWKISHRLGHAPMSRLIADLGCTGWYFRVLQAGEIEAGDTVECVERPAPGLSLARLWAVKEAHRPDPAELECLAAAPGLNSDWAARLRARAVWLATQGP